MSINIDYLSLITGFVTNTGEPIAPIKAQVDPCNKIIAVVTLNPLP
jgi:hypothetical protein